jgi:dGTPase
MRTEYVRDRDRILHCKAFRRLKHKTQVFLSPEGDHYRTRLTHTLEVSQIARSISRALRLNEDLTEAVALGHDLGHTPFGHAGERALNEFTRFEHNEQSLRVVDVLEYNFKGMNLTAEVRDGILNHTSSGKPSTLEGMVVNYSDRIAYLNHDIDDALRGGIIAESDLPKEPQEVLGRIHGIRINNMVLDLIKHSFGKNRIAMSPEFETQTKVLRDFMFERVYSESLAKTEESKAIDMLRYLFVYYKKDLSRLPKSYRDLDASDEQKICDYIATMTDRYAVKVFSDLFIPSGWHLV